MLYRLIIAGNSYLWLGNIYLSKGTIKQLSKVARKVLEIIPGIGMDNTLMIGDFNFDLSKKED